MEKIAQKRAEDQEVLRRVMATPGELGVKLHEMVVSAGLAALAEMLEAERSEICGRRYAHSSTRSASRAGHTVGELAMGGRRVSLLRPRVRDVDGREVKLKTWERFAGSDPLNKRAVEQMVIGVSTRKYERSLEDVAVATRGASKSAVSRRFVAMTQAKLDELQSSKLSAFDLVALMIDGIHIDDHVVLVALGIDSGGKKQVLGFQEGATENSRACKDLLANLQERGLPMDRSTLIVLDGSKALRKAVQDVFGGLAVVQRCQVHKRRNVLDHLPESLKKSVGTAISQAYRAAKPSTAKKRLLNLAGALEKDHPSAAASVREGLDETLTIMTFKLPAALARSLASTNALENIQGGIRRTCRRVTRWKGGSLILRWVGAALVEHSRGFKRLRGYLEIPALARELRARDAAQTAIVPQANAG